MTETNNDIKDSPIAWFYTLEDARRRNDFERAARAKRELERLGISVRYTEKKKEGAECSEAMRRLTPDLTASQIRPTDKPTTPLC